MNADESRFFAGDPPRDPGIYAGQPPDLRKPIRRASPLLVRLAIGTIQRLFAGLAVAAFCYFQCRHWWSAWYLRNKYDPPHSLGPLYFLVNASTADDWIGYTLLAVVSVCFLAFVIWPRRWTAWLAMLVALCWYIPGRIDENKRDWRWHTSLTAENHRPGIG